MDRKLISWARAVKARRRGRAAGLPVLWLFTDARRLPDPRAAASGLPRGLCGVVLRHDGVPGRAALGRDLARICRARRNALVVAGDPRLARALRAGLHLRAGRRTLVPAHPRRWLTSSAHDTAELLRARRAGAVVFLSPLFATASHPGQRCLGPVRWRLLAARAPGPVFALGGVAGPAAAALPRRIAGAGAITALAGGTAPVG